MADVSPIKRILLRVAILALCVTALVAIVAVLTAHFDDTEAQILLTHLAVAAYSLFALAVATVADRRPAVALAGWIVCGAGLLVAVLSIWAGWESGSDGLWRASAILLVAAFTIAHGSLIDSRRRESDGPAVRAIAVATIAMVIVLGLLIAMGIGANEAGDAYVRLLGVVGVLDLLGTVVLPIVRKIEQSSASTDA